MGIEHRNKAKLESTLPAEFLHEMGQDAAKFAWSSSPLNQLKDPGYVRLSTTHLGPDIEVWALYQKKGNGAQLITGYRQINGAEDAAFYEMRLHNTGVMYKSPDGQTLVPEEVRKLAKYLKKANVVGPIDLRKDHTNLHFR